MHRLSMLRAWTLAPVSFVAALGLAGCASTAASQDFDLESTPLAATRPSEILRLRTRDGDVALLAGDGARHVVVYDANGGRARSSDIRGLRATYPALYELFTNAVATHAVPAYVDATFTPSHVPLNDGRDAEAARPR